MLWRKLPGSKSAGRVQSVALRIISERELEIEKFIPQEYWSLQGEFRNKEDKIINSRLTVYDGNKVDKLDIKNESEATKIFNDIKNSTFTVGNITKKELEEIPTLLLPHLPCKLSLVVNLVLARAKQCVQLNAFMKEQTLKEKQQA